MYCGMSSTWTGSMMVAIMKANSGPRSRKRSQAKAYAASAQDTTLPMTAPSETISELAKKRQTLTPDVPPNTSV